MRTLILLTALLVSQSVSLLSQTITTDISFGINGIVTTDVFNKNDDANDIAVQTDGKIVVAGSTVVQSHFQFALLRYNEDGSVDSTFGSNGVASTFIGPANCKATALAIQPDGKILVCGYYDNNFYNDAAIARFNQDGSVDSTFGSGGVWRLTLSSQFDEFHDVVVENSGRILVGGRTFFNNTYDFLLFAILPDGSIDGLFGSNGIVRTDLGNSYDCVYSIALLANGKILVSGNKEIGSSYFAAARYHSNGIIDNGFGTGGIVTIGAGNRFDKCYGMALQNDSSIILAGTHHNSNIDEYMITKLTTNGVTDSLFGANGIVSLPATNSNDVVNDVIVQYDGRILLAGSGNGQQPVLIRLNENGAIDNTFGVNGYYATNTGSSINALNSLLMLPDSSVIMCGFTYNGLDDDFLVTKALIDFTSSIKDIREDLLVNIYPNPATEYVTVSLPFLLDGPGTITVYSQDGKYVLAHQFPFLNTQVTVGLPYLKSGIYYLEINTDEFRAVRKFVVQY